MSCPSRPPYVIDFDERKYSKAPEYASLLPGYFCLARRSLQNLPHAQHWHAWRSSWILPPSPFFVRRQPSVGCAPRTRIQTTELAICKPTCAVRMLRVMLRAAWILPRSSARLNRGASISTHSEGYTCCSFGRSKRSPEEAKRIPGTAPLSLRNPHNLARTSTRLRRACYALAAGRGVTARRTARSARRLLTLWALRTTRARVAITAWWLGAKVSASASPRN